MEFGSQFSVSVFFERTGGQQNYQGIVNNGYCKCSPYLYRILSKKESQEACCADKSGSFEIRMGREMGGEMLGGGVCTAEHEEAWDHVHIQAELGSWHHVAMVYDGARKLVSSLCAFFQERSLKPAAAQASIFMWTVSRSRTRRTMSALCSCATRRWSSARRGPARVMNISKG